MIPLCASLLLAVSVPLPSANQEWTRVTTPRFTIISATGERNTRELAHNLETLATALEAQLVTAQPPTRVIVFQRHGEAQPYLDLFLNRENSRATGVFVSQRGAATMLIDNSRGRVADRTPYHELVHHLLAGRRAVTPLWLEEGLAEYYSNAQVRGGEVRVGFPVREHLARLRRPDVMPVREVFAITRGSPRATDLLFYAESWAVVDWMLRTNRKAFDAFSNDVTIGVGPEEALRKHFRRDLAFLDSIVRAYIPAQYTTVLAVGLQIEVPALQKATYADALFELGRLLASLDRAAADADRHFHAVLDLDPHHAGALAGLGRLRSRETKDAEAFALFEKAVAADPNDGLVHLMYAEALLRPEIGGGLAETVQHSRDDVPRFRRARELAERALALHADETRSYGAIGTSYILEEDSAPGIPALERAHSLFPQRTDYPLHLLSLYLRSGQRAKAEALAAKLSTTFNPQLKAVLYSVLLREEIACINSLIFGGDRDAATAALRNLIESTRDENTRQQLTQQLAELEREP